MQAEAARQWLASTHSKSLEEPSCGRDLGWPDNLHFPCRSLGRLNPSLSLNPSPSRRPHPRSCRSAVAIGCFRRFGPEPPDQSPAYLGRRAGGPTRGSANRRKPRVVLPTGRDRIEQAQYAPDEACLEAEVPCCREGDNRVL